MEKFKVDEFRQHLKEEEKSSNTIEKYVRDVRAFESYLGGRALSRCTVAEWKQKLIDDGYKPRSINSMLASLNSYLSFTGQTGMMARNLRIQRQVYRSETDELTREEYFRLLDAAEGSPRFQLILQTICSTGIRVSELGSFTVEAVQNGVVIISCKNKMREILLPERLRELLLDYAAGRGISEGPVFLTSGGKLMSRNNIWTCMKALCKAADVDPAKVYPHNLRKLFAREFYALDKDIARLADVLGHSSIETTRIYIMGTGREHKEKMDRLALTR